MIPAKWNQWRKAFLVLASYLLYMNWKPAFALVLLVVTLVTYWGGYFLRVKIGRRFNSKKAACVVLCTACIVAVVGV